MRIRGLEQPHSSFDDMRSESETNEWGTGGGGKSATDPVG